MYWAMLPKLSWSVQMNGNDPFFFIGDWTMKKTYATSMPNHIGAFLKASKCFASLGINITRVSYDKAVDSHMLFLDVEGTEDQIRKADAELEKIGYLQNNASNSSIVLISFCLKDVPGSVTDILELIHTFNFNISYINSQENGTDYQDFKMGQKALKYRKFQSPNQVRLKEDCYR